MPEATTQLNKTTDKKTKKYRNKYTKDIVTHLEYLGYQIEHIDNDNKDYFWANNTYKYNIFVTAGEAWTYFNVRWSGYDLNAQQSIEFMQLLNESNSNSQISTWFFDEDIDKEVLVISSFASFHGYEKIGFGNFISILEFDNNTYIHKFQTFHQTSK